MGDGGSIVNMSSIFGLVGFPTSSIYSATKAALIGLIPASINQNPCAHFRRPMDMIFQG
jgi:NADP-dependent 3-hydroxy acid dehydrogenase YdfG